MVQRKAPQRLDTQAEAKRSHVKLEKQSSFNHQQDTRRRSRGGADDLKKKKMKMERSIIAADLKGVAVNKSYKLPKGTGTSPNNYMSPTSSSKRKERAQVTTIHSQTKNLNPKSLGRQSSLKSIRSLMTKKRNLNLKGVIVNKATCSSTLKDSKFPKALELNRGGTEAEGNSATRVCPYTYCSLNGHFHETLPPLKCFVSARRQLMKTQKGMKLKGPSPFEVKGAGKDKKEEVSEEEIKIGWGDEYPNESYSDLSSELSGEEMDEYVEFDEQVEEAKEENLDIVQETECSECHDEDFGLAVLFSNLSTEQKVFLNAEDEIEMSFSDKLSIDTVTTNADVDNQAKEKLLQEMNDTVDESGDDIQDPVFHDESEQQEKVSNQEGSMDNTKLGMRVIRKKMNEDMEEMKEFNPRGPHFLSVEPDPDAEHVDLRHQTMEERKNSEEWMIDYALRRKLDRAPKKKVAVLVEAFETVMPQPVWKKPTSGFPHARIIQACN